MLIGISLMILIILGFLSTIIGIDYISVPINIGIDNEVLLNGSLTTYLVEQETVLFEIDTSVFVVAGIVLLVAIGITAGITGITIIGSGLSPASVKIIIMIVSYGGIWAVLSTICVNLIASIQIFGSIIYIGLTLMYVIGVIQNLSGGSD